MTRHEVRRQPIRYPDGTNAARKQQPLLAPAPRKGGKPETRGSLSIRPATNWNARWPRLTRCLCRRE